jgi:uncharacterized membrane protein
MHGVVFIKKKIFEYSLIFFMGAIGYVVIEILWRGYTHWSMGLAGGIILSLLYFLNFKLFKLNIILKCLIGCVLITAVEFITGVFVNIIFGLKVWDYSNMPYHVMGQICPQYTVLWFVLCLFIFPLARLLKRDVFEYSDS